MGKNYANRKPESERPLNDYYPTPSCMVKELVNFMKDEFLQSSILDPCCGKYAIGNILRDNGFTNITERDLIYGNDFIGDGKNTFGDDYSNEHYSKIIMNPPFKYWDRFVEKSKLISEKIYCIGKMNFFGAHDRNVNNLWNHLEWVLPFDRQISFETPEDENGLVDCGMIVSGWFIWNMNYNGFPKIKVINMQKYIKHHLTN